MSRAVDLSQPLFFAQFGRKGFLARSKRELRAYLNAKTKTIYKRLYEFFTRTRR